MECVCVGMGVCGGGGCGGGRGRWGKLASRDPNLVLSFHSGINIYLFGPCDHP